MSERGTGHLLALTLVASGLVLVATGSTWWASTPPVRDPAVVGRALRPPPVSVVPGVVFVPSAAAPVSMPASMPASMPVRGVPVRVDVPALGIDAPVLPVHAAGGTLTPPSDAFELGWWSDGSEPGQTGVTLVTGHTVHDGPGALNDLGRLRPGDLVTVRLRGAAITYRVAAVRTFSRGGLARRSQELFASDGPSRLALVTCADWDGREYLSNVVVTAVPV